MTKHWGALAALLITTAVSPAAITMVDGDYAVSAYYTHSNGDSIISYDWSSTGVLYYATATSGYSFGGLYRSDLLSPVVAASDHFPGSSVVAIGDYIYYNTSNFQNTQFIYKYGGNPASATQVSTTANWGLYSHGGSLFITGADGWGANQIYYSEMDANGNLVSNPAVSLGVTSGASGPICFDAEGNLYYAPGYGDFSIYKWTALELNAAMTDPLENPLTVSGHLWMDYSQVYEVGGATSMLIDHEGRLVMTLTNFDAPSILASFGIGADGAYNDVTNIILTDTERLGELRLRDGTIYLSSGNDIYAVIPEPATIVLLGLGAAFVFWRRKRTPLLRFAGFTLAASNLAAGPYSQGLNDSGNPYDAPIPGFVGVHGDGKSTANGANPGNYVNPIFKGWATTVVSYAPAPGVSAGFADPNKALGAVTGDNFDIVSLGDLYDPAAPPKVGGVPVDPNVAGDGYGFIGFDAPGQITLGFNLPITNGSGADFAVFENAFISAYTTVDGSQIGQVFAELGYVEVSTDGVHFARFPSISDTANRVGAYGTVDPTNVYNLVGKHVNAYGESWGTPFDLDDLSEHEMVLSGAVNLLDINYIRIVDIPGSGAYMDSEGNPIYDAWVTWGSGGVDLDAIGVINQVPEPATWLLLAMGGLLLALRRKHLHDARARA